MGAYGEVSTANRMAETRKTGGNGAFLSKPPGKREKPQLKFVGVREWPAESSISQLFRTSTWLQMAFDSCFSESGVTAQEAAVLLHCAEHGQTSAGQLAKAVG